MIQLNCLNRRISAALSIIITIILSRTFLFILSDTSYAVGSDNINLQGKIVRNDIGYEGLNVVNGTPACVKSGPDTCNFKVGYYSADEAGTLYYEELFTGVEIGDYGGVFNLLLGSKSKNAGSEATLVDVLSKYKEVYIQISFDPSDNGSTYGEVFTRTILNASAFSVRSGGSISDSFDLYDTALANESTLNGVLGAVYFDSTNDVLRVYTSTGWQNVGGGSCLWSSEDISSLTYSQYMESTGIGALNNFSLDIDDDRLSINADQVEGGLSVYSSNSAGSNWPLVSFKADGAGFDSTILQLVQDGTGNILEMYKGSTLKSWFDNGGDLHVPIVNTSEIHLTPDGVAYFEPFASDPLSTSLNPGTNEGCIYSYGGDLYWDALCDSTAEEILNGGTGGTSLWTDGGTFTYLTATTDDLVLGSSATASSKFFFDVSEGRLGIGTDTPTAAIDIAGTTSAISNTAGDLTLSPADTFVVKDADTDIENLMEWQDSSGTVLSSINQSGAFAIGTTNSFGALNVYHATAGVPAVTGTTDANVAMRVGVQNTGLDIGVYSSGATWIQNRNITDLSSNYDLVIQPNGGDVGIGTDTPDYKLEVVGTVGVTGTLTLTGNFATGTNNTYDIGTSAARMKDVYAQGNIQIGANGDSGSIRYNTTDNQLEFSNDGSTWIPMGDLSKTVTISAEYPGAIMAAGPSGTNTGMMTSDAEDSTYNSMNYYEWNSSETERQDYDIRLRYTLPSDFLSWGTNAFTFNLATENILLAESKFDFYVYLESSATADASNVNVASTTAGVWTTASIAGADMGDCNAAGETCVILIRMFSEDDNYSRVGDIDITYNRKL
jgi:hypothetical protein